MKVRVRAARCARTRKPRSYSSISFMATQCAGVSIGREFANGQVGQGRQTLGAGWTLDSVPWSVQRSSASEDRERMTQSTRALILIHAAGDSKCFLVTDKTEGRIRTVAEQIYATRAVPQRGWHNGMSLAKWKGARPEAQAARGASCERVTRSAADERIIGMTACDRNTA